MHTQVQGKMLGKMSITCIMYTYIHSIITTIGTDWNNRIKIINMYKESTEPGKNKGENVYDDVRFMKQRWRRNKNKKKWNNPTVQQLSFSLSLMLAQNRFEKFTQKLNGKTILAVFSSFELHCTGYGYDVESCEREPISLCTRCSFVWLFFLNSLPIIL